MKLKHFNLQLGCQFLKAFSDESRIRIVHLLFRNKEMCISDIELVLDFTQTKTSRHLIYLKNAGLVDSRKVDQWTYYSVKEEVSDFVEMIYKYLDKDQNLDKDLETYKTLYNNRELAVSRLHSRKWSFQD
ncbi:MAG: metalloregulator ArsR/SmtB family transcription factor [Flammeovirgaceae bacterium]|uniref:ArsR/SmtB family transcription factor n=1 Tax=Flexithrix dorotheae TaxID=70993 RepID=UPI0003632833|nr:metalloregulator ArsR/SmtB family transcription factor [Flexithrix dorotheae]MBX2842516.1 metalloregulator ArsR/SmtB family transcription factor [Flammeovirgaceae bacterium]